MLLEFCLINQNVIYVDQAMLRRHTFEQSIHYFEQSILPFRALVRLLIVLQLTVEDTVAIEQACAHQVRYCARPGVS